MRPERDVPTATARAQRFERTRVVMPQSVVGEVLIKLDVTGGDQLAPVVLPPLEDCGDAADVRFSNADAARTPRDPGRRKPAIADDDGNKARADGLVEPERRETVATRAEDELRNGHVLRVPLTRGRDVDVLRTDEVYACGVRDVGPGMSKSEHLVSHAVRSGAPEAEEQVRGSGSITNRRQDRIGATGDRMASRPAWCARRVDPRKREARLIAAVEDEDLASVSAHEWVPAQAAKEWVIRVLLKVDEEDRVSFFGGLDPRVQTDGV